MSKAKPNLIVWRINRGDNRPSCFPFTIDITTEVVGSHTDLTQKFVLFLSEPHLSANVFQINIKTVKKIKQSFSSHKNQCSAERKRRRRRRSEHSQSQIRLAKEDENLWKWHRKQSNCFCFWLPSNDIYIYCNVMHVSGKLFNALISNDVQYGLTLSNVIGNIVVKTTNLSHNFFCHKL